LPLVRECRGIILDEADGYKVVCAPFFKFGNFGERYIPEIDWSTASVQEKLDGSLIKLWHYKNKWHVSSNGEIDAHNAHINSALLTGAPRTDLYTLFTEAWNRTGVSLEALDPHYTYMFELTSPHNRVVVWYAETAIRHIGTRDSRTLLECDMDIGIAKPKTFPLRTLEACIESAKSLDRDAEGYVVVDQYYNRMKVKSPLYVALNYLSQGVTTHGNIVEILLKNEQDEFLTYFPEYQKPFDDVMKNIESFIAQQEMDMATLKDHVFATRKDLAAAVTSMSCPACLFSLFDGKSSDAREWLFSRPPSKILQYIGLSAD